MLFMWENIKDYYWSAYLHWIKLIDSVQWLVDWNICRVLHCYAILIHVKNIKEPKFVTLFFYRD